MHTTELESKKNRVRRAMKSRLARPLDDDWITRLDRWNVSVQKIENHLVVVISGPVHVRDSALRAALSEHGYSRGDHIHRETSGKAKETVAHLYGARV